MWRSSSIKKSASRQLNFLMPLMRIYCFNRVIQHALFVPLTTGSRFKMGGKAKNGFDAASGLGTPVFLKLLSAALKTSPRDGVRVG